jgi:site-specific DNA-methyltransferase (adenine-specific)
LIELNKIYNEDCISGMHSLYEKYGEFIDLCITDPPYKISSRGTVGKNAKQKPQGILARNDGKVFDHNGINPSNYIPLIYKILKPSSHFYIFSNALNLYEIINISLKCGFKLHNILIWEKNNCTPSQYYMKNCEYILFFRKGKAKWINNIGTKTVIKVDNVKNKLHPTEKPVDLLKIYIENSSKEGDIVFDPFMGSGSLAEACINTNRNYIGFELDSKYYRIAQERIQCIV